MADHGYNNPLSDSNKIGAKFRILLAIGGIIINVLLAFVMTRLGIVFFLDTIGTIVVASVGGLFPGIFTGVLSNAIYSLFNQDAVYFCFLNAFIAIFTVWFIKKISLKKIRYLIAYALIVGFASGTISTLINWLILDGVQVARSSDTTISFASSLRISLFSAYYIYIIILNIFDKGISIFCAWFILNLIPKGILDKIERGNWKQKPLDNEEILELKKWSQKIEHHMSRRSIAIVMASSVILVVVTGWIGISMYFKSARQEKTIDAYNALVLSSEVIDPGKIDAFIENGEKEEGYLETQEFLIKIKNNTQAIENMFFIKYGKDHGTRIFDLDGEEADDIPLIIGYEEGFYEHLSRFLKGENVEPLEHGGFRNWKRSVFYPIRNDKNEVVCYGVADVSISDMQGYLKDFIVKASIILLGFFILVTAHNLWITNVTTVYPIRSMAKCVGEFSRQSYSQEQLDNNVRRIRSLNIETHDEVEQLYNSICSMTLNLSEQMRDLRRLSETTAKMQDGLIITMADMVENRDSDTGAHIQKTSAYVKIIVEGLIAKGYYAHKIDDKFVSDVIRSAPLHDIGKINIPDAILNKPGKLNEEEFEVIKTHTTMGKKIMEDAISTVMGENYLKEARNMAAYHHERWDGTGYPEGLHGEVIPLSARIMAVADVFDALTSPRVYKPAFPLDKALSIIQEAAGTQFDPKCVEVFMDNLPEVKVILRKYNKGF